MIPALTFVFGVDIHLAVGASIVSVIATSSGAAAAYVRDRMTDMRVGMFLELATTTGAVCGALLAAVVAPGVPVRAAGRGPARLGGDAGVAHGRGRRRRPIRRRGWPARLRLASSYPDRKLGREVPYSARRIPLGFVLMWIAGVVSGLLGIGSGVLKVLAMDGAMRLPMKVSSATSNFMIGVTAAASAGIYLGRGDVDPQIAAPVALGVLAGALVGARLLQPHLQPPVRLIFLPVLVGGRAGDDRPRPGVRDMTPERFRRWREHRAHRRRRRQRRAHRVRVCGGAGIGWQGSLLGLAPAGIGRHDGLLEPAGPVSRSSRPR